MKTNDKEFKELLSKMNQADMNAVLSPCDEEDKMYVEIKSRKGRDDDLCYGDKVSSFDELSFVIKKGIDVLKDAMKNESEFKNHLESFSNDEVVLLAKELKKKLNSLLFLKKFKSVLEKKGFSWFEYDWVIDDLKRLYSFKERNEVYQKALSFGKRLDVTDNCDPQRFYLLEEKDDCVQLEQTTFEKTQRIRELTLHFKDFKEEK